MADRRFPWNQLQVVVDPRPQILRLEMDPMASWSEMRAVGRRRREGDLVVIEYEARERFEAPLYPCVAALPAEAPFVSAAVLAQKAKAVDDGIVAALELLLDEGTHRLRGRAALLADIQGQLRERWERSPEDGARAEAIGRLSAVRSLSRDDECEDTTDWPTALRLARARCVQDLRGKSGRDVPLGVFTWSRRLAGLYRQGKALQEPLPDEVASALAEAIESDEGRRGAYETHLDLLAVTNPLVRPGVSRRGIHVDPGQAPALFPSSDTPEGRLVKRLVGTNPVPAGFDLIGELIARIRDGRLSLATTGESGWYDRVLHALEPLLVPDRTPEAGKLRLAEDYREDLAQLFRSILGSVRESHVKQIELPMAGGCPLVIAPELTFEPLAEHYRRRAASYRFVRERLVGALGEDVLQSRRRLTPGGEIGPRLLDEVLAMEQLFTGAWAIVLDELGMTPEVAGGDAGRVLASRSAARSWAETHRDDPDLREDVRMMVPLFEDPGREEFHVLVVVGFEHRNLKVGFVERPEVSVRDARGRAVEHPLDWRDRSYPMARPVTLACRTRRLLDRDEFRALCDRAGSLAAIRSAVEAGIAP